MRIVRAGCLRDLLALLIKFVLFVIVGTAMLALCEWAAWAVQLQKLY